MANKYENEIQEEIRKQVLEQHELNKQEQEKIEHTNSTIEALEDITGISKKKLSAIAKKVRSNYREKEANKKKIAVTAGLACALLVLGGAILLFFNKSVETTPVKKIPVVYNNKLSAKVVFTTEIKNSKPVNSLEEISINEKKIIFYVKLINLEVGKPYRFTCKIHDGAGTLLFENTSDPFTSNSNNYLRWCWFKIDKFTEEPGMWRFDGLMNGKLITSKTLKVNPAN